MLSLPLPYIQFHHTPATATIIPKGGTAAAAAGAGAGAAREIEGER